MAKVKIEEIVDHLSSEMRKALVEAVRAATDLEVIDDRALFREFKGQSGAGATLGRKYRIPASTQNESPLC